jgi:hypothetical protein
VRRGRITTLALLLGALALPVRAAQVDVYLFWRLGCPHCEREIEFLDRLAAREPEVRVHRFEVLRDRAGAALMARVAEALRAEAGSVPFTVVGDRVWTGYLDDASTGREIEERIAECRAAGCPDSVAPILAGAAPPAAAPAQRAAKLPETLRVPLVGEVRTASLSLPALTVALAAVDGFNPCAMWVLVFLLGLLAGMKDRARMWALGGAFVAASALVYLLILGAWLNALLLVGALAWVRVGVGVVALAGGAYYLREFATRADMACEVTAPANRRRVLARLRDLASRRGFLAALGGIVALAFAVNVVEFLCSAGIPAVFTQVLALSALSSLQYAAYLALYVLVFMLDDLVVLVGALKALEVTGLTTTYARWSNLVGGALLLPIGALLVLRPEWLAFG